VTNWPSTRAQRVVAGLTRIGWGVRGSRARIACSHDLDSRTSCSRFTMARRSGPACSLVLPSTLGSSRTTCEDRVAAGQPDAADGAWRAGAPPLIWVFDERLWASRLVKARLRKANVAVASTDPRIGAVWKSGGTPRQRVGFAWYTKGQWQRLREIADDREVLDDSYEDWRQAAERAVADLRSNGVAVRKLFINVEEAAAWCAINKRRRRFNSAARSAFVIELLKAR